MRLLLLGDTHGNATWIKYALDYARDNDVRTILQLGDFGYWCHTPDGERYLDRCEVMLSERYQELYWLDGNHENHKLLRARLGNVYQRYYGLSDDYTEAAYKIRDRVYYLPRGVRWNWDGCHFMALGGAYSIDANFRVPGTSVWPDEEIISDEEVEYASRDGVVDVMVTHDAPWTRNQDSESDYYDRRFPRSKVNKQKIQKVMDAVQPKLLAHGHQHRRYDKQVGRTAIKGLGMDGDMGSLLVIDTEEWKK